MSQDSVEEIETYEPEYRESVSSEEQDREIDALQDKIGDGRRNLDAERVYDELSDKELADARFNARRACLEHGDFSKYMDFLVNEVIGKHQSKKR